MNNTEEQCIMHFKKFSGIEINTIDYIKDYINKNNDKNIEIIIGSDSQNKNNKTVYSTVIVLYTPGHGGHCIFKRWKTPKEKVKNVRLLKEVEESINIANVLVENGLPKPKYIDLDINPNPKYKSNEVYQTAKGWVESLGYEVRFKTIAPLVTTAADWIVRH
jgi:predicted RNase H-related nuclease YkuK (DUF458 family)